MYVKDLNSILYGNVLFRRWNEDKEEFETIKQFASYNTEDRTGRLMEMEVMSIGLADVGEYDGEKCVSDKGIIVIEVQ